MDMPIEQIVVQACHAAQESGLAFDEPSWDFGFTSFASEPVYNHQRSVFRKYRLFAGGPK